MTNQSSSKPPKHLSTNEPSVPFRQPPSSFSTVIESSKQMRNLYVKLQRILLSPLPTRKGKKKPMKLPSRFTFSEADLYLSRLTPPSSLNVPIDWRSFPLSKVDLLTVRRLRRRLRLLYVHYQA